MAEDDPINTLFAWPIALALRNVVAIGAFFPPQGPQRVDGFRATDEYARSIGYRANPVRERALRELAMGPDYWRGGRGHVRRSAPPGSL